LSSAILYLAIVAIWACVLVPRWLHRSHENPSGSELLADSDETAGFEEEDAEFDEDSDAPTEEFAPVSRSRAGPVAETYVAVETGYVQAGYVQAGYVRAGYVAEAGYAGEAPAPPGFTGHSHLPAGSPPASRDRVLQTRRRLLTILVVLTAGAVGGTITGITMWWTIVPPAIMLGLYVLLLREAAQADAENEIRRAEAQAAAEAAHAAAVARAREREALAAQAPQPTAEIIDITARTARDRDQLYDQYADATVRAVGD
jgi:hypothetical protein